MDGDNDAGIGCGLKPDAEEEVIAGVIVPVHALASPDTIDDGIIGEVLEAQGDSDPAGGDGPREDGDLG
ncbi:MAG TPA: hypothetical protein VF942_14965 [Acidimicrobiales bacterium]